MHPFLHAVANDSRAAEKRIEYYHKIEFLDFDLICLYIIEWQPLVATSFSMMHPFLHATVNYSLAVEKRIKYDYKVELHDCDLIGLYIIEWQYISSCKIFAAT